MFQWRIYGKYTSENFRCYVPCRRKVIPVCLVCQVMLHVWQRGSVITWCMRVYVFSGDAARGSAATSSRGVCMLVFIGWCCTWASAAASSRGVCMLVFVGWWCTLQSLSLCIKSTSKYKKSNSLGVGSLFNILLLTERVPSRVSITPPHSFSRADLVTCTGSWLHVWCLTTSVHS